jgi:hypothetical protein
MPLLCGLALKNSWRTAIGSFGWQPARWGNNPAKSGGRVGRGRARGGAGVARGRFRPKFEAVVASAMGLGGDGWC